MSTRAEAPGRFGPVPRDPAPDSSIALLREGYGFIPTRCRQYGSDLFETRLMLKRAVCMTGADAARQFYRPDQFTRRGGMPQSTFALIQGLAPLRMRAMWAAVTLLVINLIGLGLGPTLIGLLSDLLRPAARAGAGAPRMR